MALYNRILVTGARGRLGSELRSSLGRLANTVRLSDLSSCDCLSAHEEDYPADLVAADMVDRAVAGCDAILHFGGHRREAEWKTILDANIVGSYNVFEAARRHRVKRVVFASSSHTVGFYSALDLISAAVPMRPDSLYGVSKTFVENLARYYYDKFAIEAVALRIGSALREPTERRHLLTWLSYRDLHQLVEKALVTPDVGYLVAYGVSNNTKTYWDNTDASKLGYHPVDSSLSYEPSMLAQDMPGRVDSQGELQGGSFAAAGHFEDGGCDNRS